MRMNISERIGLSELKTANFWRAVAAEFLVTVLYIIIVCAAGLSEEGSTNKSSHLHISLTVGFTVSVLASGFWDISGGHFNPVVTLALFVLKKVSFCRLIVYLIVQCAGSVVGSALLYSYIPTNMRGGLGALSLHKDVGLGVGFLIEATITFQLIWTTISSTDPKKKFIGFQPPLAIGMSVAIGLLSAIPYTGAAMNPIRAFGPAIVMDKRKDHWVYWVGPATGSLLATLSYEYIFKISKCTEEETKKRYVERTNKSNNSQVKENHMIMMPMANTHAYID